MHGDGEASESFTILAATIPNTPLPPTVSFDTQGDYVIVMVEPNTGGAGVKILEYAIEVKSKNESYLTPASCISSPEILLTKECFVTLEHFQAPQFGLVQGDRILVRVRARNEIGWSQYSNVSLGDVLVVALPHAPTEGPIRDDYVHGSSLTQIKMRLPEIAGVKTGGLPILSYSLQASKDQVSWITLCGVVADYTQTHFVHSGLTTGDAWYYKY